jgi:MoxR-like ATPase
MNFWHMQLHPDNRNAFPPELIRKMLNDISYIGLGGGDDNSQVVAFKTQMKIGDVVAIRSGRTPIALVEIIGDWEYKDDTDEGLDFFDNRRKIKILDCQNNYNFIIPMAMGTLSVCANQNVRTTIVIKEWYNRIKEEIETMKLKIELTQLLNSNKNLILTGAPGAGKTYLAKELAKSITQAEENSSQIASVQFHPSYDYSDFIEGLKPKISNGQMEFEPKAGVFKSFCEVAGKSENKDKKYVFIIDEINRADLSRVFGEAFSLLEESYRGHFIETQYSYITGNKFTIPENVYIIGTMNDVDRSVESMDFALRRRFAWREISAKDSESIIDVADIDQQWKVEAKKRMASLNDKIEEILESTSYQIGGAYYKKLEKYKTSNDISEAFKQLWNNHIAVLLHE